MKPLLFFFLSIIISSAQSESKQGWEQLRDTYVKHQRHRPDLARKALLEMGRINDPRALAFMRDIYLHAKPDIHPDYIKHPEIKKRDTMAGVAQIALAQAGEVDVRQELVKQSFHPDEFVRHDAVEKIKKLEGDWVIEMLSNFLGDMDEESERLDNNEWFALWELVKRLPDPPTPFVELHHVKHYYLEGGKEKWLKWRYDHFGVIPGRETLFESFIAQGPPKTVKLTANDYRSTKPTQVKSKDPEAAKADSVQASSSAWRWMAAGGVGLAAFIILCFVWRSRIQKQP